MGCTWRVGKSRAHHEVLVPASSLISYARLPGVAGHALALAGRLRDGGQQMVEGDVSAVEGVAGRQVGLEHQHRSCALG
jgi:hypothetical protein